MASKSSDRKFKLELQLLNGELHEFEFSLRYTVDKVKEHIFNKVKSLNGASRLDYQLGFTPEVRLTVEFVKFTECHEDVKKVFAKVKSGEQAVVRLSLFPRSGKKLQRQLSVSALPNMRSATITHKKLGSYMGSSLFAPGDISMPEPLRADVAQAKEEVLGPTSPKSAPKRQMLLPSLSLAPPETSSTSLSAQQATSSSSTPVTPVSKPTRPAAAAIFPTSETRDSGAATGRLTPSTSGSSSSSITETKDGSNKSSPEAKPVDVLSSKRDSSKPDPLKLPTESSKKNTESAKLGAQSQDSARSVSPSKSSGSLKTSRSQPNSKSPLALSSDHAGNFIVFDQDNDEDYLSAESFSDDEEYDADEDPSHRRSNRSQSFSAGDAMTKKRTIERPTSPLSARDRRGSFASTPSNDPVAISPTEVSPLGAIDEEDPKKKKKKKLSRDRKEKTPSKKQLKPISPVESGSGSESRSARKDGKERKVSKKKLQVNLEAVPPSMLTHKTSKAKLEKAHTESQAHTSSSKEVGAKVKRKKSASTLDTSIVKRTDFDNDLTVIIPSGVAGFGEDEKTVSPPSSGRTPRRTPGIKSKDLLESTRDSVELTEAQLEALNSHVSRRASGGLTSNSSPSLGPVVRQISHPNGLTDSIGKSKSISSEKLREMKELAELRELLDGPMPPDFVTRGDGSAPASPYAFSPKRNSGLYGGAPSPTGSRSPLPKSSSTTPPSGNGVLARSDQGQRLQIRGPSSLGSDEAVTSPLSHTEEDPIVIDGERAESELVAQLRLSDDDFYSTMRRGSRLAIQTRNRSNSLLANDIFAIGRESTRARFDLPSPTGPPAAGPQFNTPPASSHVPHYASPSAITSSTPTSPVMAPASSKLSTSSSGRPSYAEMRSGSFSIETSLGRSKIISRNGVVGISEVAESPEILSDSESRRRASQARGSVRAAPLLMKPCRGFWVEVGRESLTPELVLAQQIYAIENAADEKLWYAEYFASYPHFNYLGVDGSGDPFALSVIKPQGANMMRVLLRTRRGDERQVVAESKETAKMFKAKIPVQDLMRLIAPSLTGVKMRSVKDLNLIYELMKFEERLRVKTYKFGILLCKEGQTKEEEMFSNEYGSEHYDAFLNLLGDTVQLKGWDKFKGGLDTERDSTGTHSIYTQFEGNEIMFHVSTLLPFSTDNPQQLERKRHLGNDIVVLIFKEGNTPYIPNTISSEFIHVLGLVQPETINNHVKYRFAIASKDGVPTFSPSLPASGLFEPGQAFRNLILTKLINGERAAYKSAAFAGKMQRTRQIMLKDLDQRFK